MCQRIIATIHANGTASVAPVECEGTGETCRDLSAPYRKSLGSVLRDVDALGGKSHIVTASIDASDLDILDSACGRVGVKLNRGQTSFRWYSSGYGTNDKCAHAISVPNNRNAYEIGVIPDGEKMTLKYDFFGDAGHAMSRLVGDDIGLLKQAYGVEAMLATVPTQSGHSLISELRQDDGSIRLEIEVMAGVGVAAY